MASPQPPENMRPAFRRFIAGEPDEKGEQRAYCPMHEDPTTSKSPSASLNFPRDVWHCMGCDEGGSITALWRKLAQERDDGVSSNGHKPAVDDGSPSQDPGVKRSAPSAPAELPTEQQLYFWRRQLLDSTKRLEFLINERGLLPSTIDEFAIGWDGRRYTIPIEDIDGNLVNVRRYDPHADDSSSKMISIRSHGVGRIYSPDILRDMEGNDVVIVEGEMDFLIGYQNGLPVITHTAGASVFDKRWGMSFADKCVFICYDNDAAGERGALKAARYLEPHASAVCIMRLPIEGKGADLTDFFVRDKLTTKEFYESMEEARRKPFSVRQGSDVMHPAGRRVTLEESQDVIYNDEPIEMVVQVIGKQTPAFEAAKKLRATCDQDKGTVCNTCPMSVTWHGEKVVKFEANDPSLVSLINIPHKEKDALYKKMAGARCTDHISYDVEEKWTIEHLIVGKSIDAKHDTPAEEGVSLTREIYNVGTFKTPVNTTVRVVGRQIPDPKTQRGLFVSDHLEETKTSLDNFKIDDTMKKELTVFRPGKDQTPLDKLQEITHDLSLNVTHIYGRPDLHIAYNIVWHSAINFNFLGTPIGKGWLEMLVMGDTRTGKSEAATKMAAHYNAGTLKSCEGMTTPGLIATVSSMRGGANGSPSWMVSWGVVPLNDRRLVILDEMSSLKGKDILEEMSSIRSSGRAQITKAGTSETSARTRLIWISNPVDGSRLAASPSSAIKAIQDLVTKPEDLARFDFVMAATSSDVSSEVINNVHPEHTEHIYTKEICEKLVLWTWSRTLEQILWEADVEEYVVRSAVAMGDRYESDPPIIQVENARMKVARIAVAIAACNFSTDDTGEFLIVGLEHVDAAVAFLDSLYSTTAMGYLQRSQQIKKDAKKAAKNRTEVITYLTSDRAEELLRTLPSAAAVFRIRDLEEGGMDREGARIAVHNLADWKMISVQTRGYYKKTPELDSILQEIAYTRESDEGEIS